MSRLPPRARERRLRPRNKQPPGLSATLMHPAVERNAPRESRPASLARRGLALIYEMLLLAAVLFAGALPFLIFTRHMETAEMRPLFQLYLLVLCGGYFIWQWLRGGQTLPMKTWHLRLAALNGTPLTPRQAIYRYIFALLGLGLLGAGFLWALVDRERQFLHDRLAGTRIIDS